MSDTTDLPEDVWAIVASYAGFVGAARMQSVCKSAYVGASRYLSTLSKLIVAGGHFGYWENEEVSDLTFCLDNISKRWIPLARLNTPRTFHACCVANGSLVVIGGFNNALNPIDTMHTYETLRHDVVGFVEHDIEDQEDGFSDHAAVFLEKTNKIMIIGGPMSQEVCEIDAITHTCSYPERHRGVEFDEPSYVIAAELPGDRVVCTDCCSSLFLYSLKTQQWSQLAMEPTSPRYGSASSCATSDGRFFMLGGYAEEGGNQTEDSNVLSACECLQLDDNGTPQWTAISPMRHARAGAACGVIGGCIVVAGGQGSSNTAEVYDESTESWYVLPFKLPSNREYSYIAGAVVK